MTTLIGSKNGSRSGGRKGSAIRNSAGMEFPSTREEAWKYTPVQEIVNRLDAALPAMGSVPASALSRRIVDELASAELGPRLVFVNGAYDAVLSGRHDLPAGLWCGPLSPHHSRAVINTGVKQRAVAGIELEESIASQATAGHTDGFLALNHDEHKDSALIVVDPNVHIEVPIQVVHVSIPAKHDDESALDGHGATATVSYPRTIIDAGDGCAVSIVETFCGLDGPAVTDAATTIRVGHRSDVDFFRVQTESVDATHIGHTSIEQEAGSHFRMISVTRGSDIARNAVALRLVGADATAELSGVNVTTGRQRHDTAITVDHSAPKCTSTQRFTGVVDDRGHCSFSGEIIVRPGMVATDAQQFNGNLVLGPKAEADSRPWLQILADDVRCTHGATVGRLDEDALFYLRSRGIPFDQARSMLIDAFISDITSAIPHAVLRDHVAALTAARSGPEPSSPPVLP